jgi:hypothetical protein
VLFPAAVSTVPGPSGPPGTVTNNGFWTTLEEHDGVADLDPVEGTGTDNLAAINEALADLFDRGGGTLLLGRGYLFSGCPTFPNSNTLGAMGTQPAIRIVGQGSGSNGAQSGLKYKGASILYWDDEDGDVPAFLTTLGLGSLDLVDFQIGCRAGLTKDFIHTTNTTIFARRVSAFSENVGTARTQKMFVLGGTYDTEADPTHDRRLPDNPFQGYNTVIEQCALVGGMGHLAHVQRFGNAIRILNNAVSIGNGPGVGNGGRIIELDGSPGDDSGSFSTGCVIENNLLEGTGYDKGVVLRYCADTHVIANDVFDAAASFIPVDISPTCTNIYVRAGARPTAGIYTNDPGDRALVEDAAANTERTKIPVLRTTQSTSEFPNLLGATQFTGTGASAPLIQPTVATIDGVVIRTARRSETEAVDPDGVIENLFYGGAKEIGGAFAGNVVNNAPNSMQYSANGKRMEASSGFLDRKTPDGYIRDHALRHLRHLPNETTILGGELGTGIHVGPTRVAATTLGAVVGKYAIVNDAGTVVGYVPIYDAIT